jgi:glycosyltransferase involved in cell wall biosynthesis
MFYVNTLRRGGAERVFANLANMFAQAEYRVVFVTSFRDSEWEYSLHEKVKRCSIEDDEIKQSLLKRNVRRTRALRRLVIAEKPDLLIATSPEANYRSIIAAVGKKTKTVITIISDPKQEYASKIYHLLAVTLYRLASGTVFQTEEQKSWFPEGVRRKSAIILNQVDEKFFIQPLPETRKDIVAVGRTIPIKRHEVIIRAFHRIAGDIADNLYIYGDGPLRDELIGLVAELGLSGRVFLPGRIDDVAAKTFDAKLFVMASEYEGLPNALMEAMALGIPCIASDCSGGGPRALLDGGKYGVLVPVNDIDALAESMKSFMEDENLARKYSLLAKEQAENFRPEKIFDHWCHYLQSIG